MARSTRRDTDFNIRQALKRTRSQLLGAQESGRAALAGYEELAPQYNRAVEQARNFQSTLTRDYNRYVQDRQAASTQYQNLLQERKSAYDQAVAAGAPLRQRVASAKTDLDQLERLISRSAQEATGLYDRYQQQYQAGVKVGQQQYETKLAGFQERGQKLTQDYQRFQGNIELLNRQIGIQQSNIERQRNIAQQYLGTAELGGRFVVDSTNKIYRVFTDNNNQFTGAQEYRTQGAGYAQGLGQVTDSGYGSLTETLKFLARQGTKTFADAVYERYRRGASPYGTYQAVARQTQNYGRLAQQAMDEASVFERNIQSFQAEIPRVQQAISGVLAQNRALDQEVSAFQADQDFVTRIAQQQSAGALADYDRYLSSTYNPMVQAQQTILLETYNPAVAALNEYQSGGQVQRALQDYQSLQQDTGFVDRAASDTKAVYDASQQEYGRLQAAYEGMTPQLNQYTEQAEAAKQQVLSLQGMTPGLQRSLAIDTEARKRGTRLGYRRSVLSQDFKRRGAAR